MFDYSDYHASEFLDVFHLTSAQTRIKIVYAAASIVIMKSRGSVMHMMSTTFKVVAKSTSEQHREREISHIPIYIHTGFLSIMNETLNKTMKCLFRAAPITITPVMSAFLPFKIHRSLHWWPYPGHSNYHSIAKRPEKLIFVTVGFRFTKIVSVHEQSAPRVRSDFEGSNFSSRRLRRILKY